MYYASSIVPGRLINYYLPVISLADSDTSELMGFLLLSLSFVVLN